LSGTSKIRDDAAAEGVVFEQLEPLVRRIVRWRLGTTAPPQDQEDVAGDVLLELFVRLNSSSQGGPIADLSAYAAVTTHHGCDLYLRRRFPQRHRLSTRLRYLLETSNSYALWEVDSTQVCGMAKRRGSAAAPELEPGWAKQVPLPARANEAAAVAAILDYSGGAIRFSDLVEGVASLLDIRDQVRSTDTANLAAPTHDPAARIDQRRALDLLWREIALLPGMQRIALLLNLRDDVGACALTSLPATGIASMRQIAEVIGIPPDELAQIWKSLPLSDLDIAARLGLTRQQVINLRKSARQRLTRRMTGNIGPETASKEVNPERV
jgi:DNA-directed RNA polymerase specialized sigma24 family protein